MSVSEYSYELYEAVDNVRECFWFDDVFEDIETIMWYAGLTEEFQNSDISEWNDLLKQAQEILHLDLGR